MIRMQTLVVIVAGWVLLAAVPLFAQDEDGAESADSPPAVPAADPALPATDADEAGTPAAGDDAVPETDDESYLDIDQEEFTPSEEIPLDQSIAFPTDI